MPFDKFHDECGIFGVFNHPEASNLTYLGLYALQHRGQESAGIVSQNDHILHTHKGMGLVADIFTEDVLRVLPGSSAIGHVRYSTAGASKIENSQPFVVSGGLGNLAIAHNGNLTNAMEIREELESYGSIFQSTMDTEVIVHLMAISREKTLLNRLIDALVRIQGAYSLLLITKDAMIAVRDSHGFRPLALGKIDSGTVVASESCAFDLIDATFEREVEPGEIVYIDREGVRSYKPFAPVKESPCVFEFIYFARPDSLIFGRNVYEIRKELGRQLAREYPQEADIVIPVPDSGMPAAIGYAQEAGIPLELGLIRNHYVGRTFIEPKQSIRHFGVKIKLNPVRNILKGKRVVVIDDSIVRATTGRKIVKMIRSGGATHIHFYISSPPTRFPCFYGIDTPTKKELIANSHNLEEIQRYITSDSIGYLSMEGLRCVVKSKASSFCYACFDGNYPLEFPEKIPEPQMPLFYNLAK
jgi:amidophosphoribosyltransferase